MDDDMEDEIIHEIFTAHVHLIWKYFSITSASIVEMILPGPGESLKSKMFQPGPFMLITFFIIISSIILQTRNNWFQKALLTFHKTISLNVVADHGLKSFVTASIGSDAGNITQDLTEGLAGVYALQGRRGTMEDRFSVLQDIDVGGSNKLSFYGVYDGHGGQFVAEYVKQNLCINTVQKIRQLRSFHKDKSDTHLSTGCKKDEGRDLSQRRKSSATSISSSVEKPDVERRTSLTASLDGNLNIVEEESTKAVDSEAKENLSVEKEEDKTGCKVEEVKIADKCDIVKEMKDDNTGCLKKEDPYSSVSLKKKNSFSNASESKTKETNIKNDSLNNNTYVDVNSNVNYTKLLTEQIMDIDKKVVEFCKSKTDLSGTTAVIAVLDGELLIIGNVGDSRAVMGDLKGSTIPLSFDHKPNQLKEHRRIKENGGFITFTGVWRVAGILATSRALGDFPLKDPRKLITAEPDVLTFSLKDHKAQFVILATDGLWDVMSNEEAVAFIRNHIHERDYGSRSLVQHAYDKGSQDNITVMILNLSKLSL